ncbi:MAG: Hsp20/alpha crystallin family protein [Desulfovibrio sp.]|jgi:HSP20 family protein|nr:Hsp20/alpha crystallin family protein [Desulfovibrio sp.]
MTTYITPIGLIANAAPGFRSTPAIVARRPVARFDDEIDRLFDDFASPWFDYDLPRSDESKARAMGSMIPRMDMRSDDKAYTIVAELPGVPMDGIVLETRENILTLRGEKRVETPKAPEEGRTAEAREGGEDGGDEKPQTTVHVQERFHGSFRRVLAMPDDADMDGIKASLKDGVLTVTVPKKVEKEPATRTIAIERS